MRPHDQDQDPIDQALVQLIAQLGVGGRLPSERDLALELGCSRTALRDRLQRMESFGVLRRVTGSGTYVQTIDPRGLSLALNIALGSAQIPPHALHRSQVAMERQAAVEAASLRDPVLVAHIEKALRVMESAETEADTESADQDFHKALLRASGNPALTFFAEALSGVLDGERTREDHRSGIRVHRRQEMIALHGALHRAIANGDGKAASEAVDAHYETYERLLSEGQDA